MNKIVLLIIFAVAGFLIYGLALGYLMRENGTEFNIHRMVDRGIWSVMCLSLFMGLFSGATLLVNAMGYGLMV